MYFKYVKFVLPAIMMFSSSLLFAQEGKYYALFVVKLSENVNWKQDQSKIVIGVLGTSDFYKNLQEFIQFKESFEAFEMNAVADYEKCNVVFVSGSANEQIGQLSSVIGDRPILIIGDEQKLVKGGADIGLYLEKGKLQFIYSESSIASKGLIISSQLMNLGKSLQ